LLSVFSKRIKINAMENTRLSSQILLACIKSDQDASRVFTMMCDLPTRLNASGGILACNILKTDEN